MRFSGLLALAAGNVASAAMYSNTTSAAPEPTNPVGFPDMVGPFKFLGCYASSDGLSGFEQVASDNSMTLNLCAASCPSKYMAVFGMDCLCGKSLDTSTTMKVDTKRCNTPCPGMKSQFCGGKGQSMGKRDVEASDAVSLYERTDSGTTSTKTVTRTTVGTVTSCPPEVKNCPVGQKTWHVKTSTIEVCPTPAPEWHKKKTVCYGDCCAPAYPGGKKQRVICQGNKCHTEECDTTSWYKLVQCKGSNCNYTKCKGDECNRKVVCYDGKCIVEKCYGNECNTNLVCHGNQCKHEQCNGNQCHQTIQCDTNGGNCKNVPANNNAAPGPNNNSGSNSQGNNGQGNNGQGSNGQGNNGQGSNGQGSNGQGNNGQGSNGQGSNGQGSNGQGSNGQGSNGQGSNGQGSNGQGSNGQGSNGQGNNGQGSNSQGSNGQGSNGQGSNGQGNNGANAGGSPAGGAQPTNGPVIAAAEGIAANLLGVAAGLFFVL